MQQIDWSRVDYGILLLAALGMLYLYFLPSLLAFQRGHRRFLIILGLNILLGWLQPILLQFLSPVDIATLPPAQQVWVAFLF